MSRGPQRYSHPSITHDDHHTRAQSPKSPQSPQSNSVEYGPPSARQEKKNKPLIFFPQKRKKALDLLREGIATRQICMMTRVPRKVLAEALQNDPEFKKVAEDNRREVYEAKKRLQNIHNISNQVNRAMKSPPPQPQDRGKSSNKVTLPSFRDATGKIDWPRYTASVMTDSEYHANFPYDCSPSAPDDESLERPDDQSGD